MALLATMSLLSNSGEAKHTCSNRSCNANLQLSRRIKTIAKQRCIFTVKLSSSYPVPPPSPYNVGSQMVIPGLLPGANIAWWGTGDLWGSSTCSGSSLCILCVFYVCSLCVLSLIFVCFLSVLRVFSLCSLRVLCLFFLCSL